ncbi:MAG: tetratricopeptide repeat protein [Gemmataceae bacterium]
MSMKLSFSAQLLARGKQCQEQGRWLDAQTILQQVTSFRGLSVDIAEEAHARLAEVLLELGRWKRARRHLRLALLYRPDCARYHYLLARILSSDALGDPDRALEHYRQALSLEPDNSTYLSEFGLLAIDLGEYDEGLTALRRAVELEPEDPTPLSRLVEGLCLADEPAEARRVLRAALFRQAGDPRFRQLWNDFQFQRVYELQEARIPEAPVVRDEEPTLLPFPSSVPAHHDGAVTPCVVRRDAAAPPSAPHFWTTQPSDQKQA